MTFGNTIKIRGSGGDIFDDEIDLLWLIILKVKNDVILRKIIY